VRDIKIQCTCLRDTAEASWQLGKYREAQLKTGEMRRLAQVHGLFYTEAQAIRVDLLCRVSRGDLASAVQLSAHARELLAFCGLQGSTTDLALIASDADVHFQKTEYSEARALFSGMSPDAAPLAGAYDRLSIASIDIETGIETGRIRQELDSIKAAFESIKNPPGIVFCEMFQAYLDIREGLLLKARLSLEKSFAQTRGNDQEISILCLNKLGDITLKMDNVQSTLGWALVLLAFALKGENTIAVHHALRCLADIFIAQDDDETALNLLDVALDGFTAMDIHRSRAECAMRIGDIFHRRGDEAKAVEHWELSRPLFLRSLQTKEVVQIDQRIRTCRSQVP
jgi:hypothetical protein